MSTAARPPRRLPSRVYWRRRLTVVAMLVLVLAAVWQTRVNRGDSDETSAPSAPGQGDVAAEPGGSGAEAGASGVRRLAASASVGAAASASSVPALTRAVASSPRVRPVLAQPVGRCDPTATIAQADAPQPVTSGTGATLQVRLSTTATEACTLVLTERLLVQVARDEEPVWRLQDCPAALTTASVVLQPAWSTVIDIAWSGRVSNAKCGLETAAAAPGTYSLQAAILSGEPGTTVLQVKAAERSESAGRRDAG